MRKKETGRQADTEQLHTIVDVIYTHVQAKKSKHKDVAGWDGMRYIERGRMRWGGHKAT